MQDDPGVNQSASLRAHTYRAHEGVGEPLFENEKKNLWHEIASEKTHVKDRRNDVAARGGRRIERGKWEGFEGTGFRRR